MNYSCPGCKYLNKNTFLKEDAFLKCKVCLNDSEIVSDPKIKYLLDTFKYHTRLGFTCNLCARFIPFSKNEVKCPYPDCHFIGNPDSLKRTNHPLSNTEDNFNSKINPLLKTIDELISVIPYTSHDFTAHSKIIAYKAIKNLLIKDSGMFDYLINSSRKGGFQNKIFQEYIRLIENSFPFQIKKKNKSIVIDSLLDENLCLFDGISKFKAKVLSNLTIKNNTEEFYIGSKSGYYSQPYYIGKLLSILDENNNSLMNKVKEYSFSKIKLENIEPNINVTVIHLRVPPHYQIGGMSYINRARKDIIENVKK